MTAQTAFGLFEVVGVEIEFMIVDTHSLDIQPLADRLLRQISGGREWVEDVSMGEIDASNELVNHVVEVKCAAPSPSLEALVPAFGAAVQRLNHALDSVSARLMPGGMHPWMEPHVETRLWGHETGPVYRAYDELFDCRRHGWANLQSVHLNLPFKNDEEFGRLMAAVRVVLPLIPALAASSPLVEERANGCLDNRLRIYATNSAKVPAMTGQVIPEPVYSIEAYRDEILAPIDRQLREIGAPAILLGREWGNARGAIARFDRNAVEVRLIDAQECPRADLAVCAAVSGAIRAMVEERWSDGAAQRGFDQEALVSQLQRTVDQGRHAAVEAPYARLFGADPAEVRTTGALWTWLVENAFGASAALEPPLAVILEKGALAERILAALPRRPERRDLEAVYRELCGCLSAGWSFRG